MAVRVETSGTVRVLRLDRPEKKNALTQAMYAALSAGLAAAEADPAVRAVVLAGGADFTAGNDLADFAGTRGDGPSEAFRFLQALRRFGKPLLAAVRGHAVGIGTTLLLHCDATVAAQDARLLMPFTKLGLVPEGGSSLLLARRVGAARARWWLMAAAPIGGQEAAAAGLVTQAVPDGEVEATAMAMAEALAALPPEALRETKRLLRAPDEAALDAAMDAEFTAFAERLRSEEAQAVFRAFLSRKG